MSRSLLSIALLSFGLATLVPVAAFADDNQPRTEKRAKGDHAKHFPMTAAKFKEKVEARIVKAKGRLTERMKEHNVPADKQKAVMADFESGATKVRAAADAAGKDGTVTAEEAKDVRALAKELRKEAHQKYGKGKGKKGKKGADA